MALPVDAVLDRLQLKSKIRTWRILAIVALLAVALVIFRDATDSRYSPIPSSHIARLSITGVIEDDPRLHDLIQELKEDDHVKAVVVWLDTPGGTAVGGEQLYLDLRSLSAAKPTVSVMRSMATSAGYMAALGTDHIVARAGTITGSIGVILQTAEFTELAKKVGIEPITVKSSPLKGAPSPFEKFSPEQRESIQFVLDNFYEFFLRITAERRKLTPEQLKSLADGRIFTGSQALERKLIDAIGGEEEATQWLEKTHKVSADLEIRDATIKEEHPSLFQNLEQLASGRLMRGVLNQSHGLMSIWSVQ